MIPPQLQILLHRTNMTRYHRLYTKMPDRRGPTVETALKAADHRRNLERRRQPDYAPLPLTRDRISRYSTFALTEYSLPPLRSRPSTSQSQHDEFLKAGRSPFVKATFQPTQEERAALWANARRARTADARFALIVGFGGDARSTLSLPALEGLTPLPAKDLWPAHYTEENLRVCFGKLYLRHDMLIVC